MSSNIFFHEKVVIRTPVLPQKNSLSLEEIKALLNFPKILEAIHVASPSLSLEIDKWHKGELDDKKEEKMFESCYKYLIRMMNRATPFGLFSGCTVLQWGEKNNILLSENLNRHTRLDMFFLCKLSSSLEKNVLIKELLYFQPNTSINISNKKITYIEYEYKGERRFHSSQEVDLDPYLSFILEITAKGITINKMVEGLLSFDEELEIDEIREYIDSLIDAQILISNLYPNVTGPGYFDEILSTLKKIKADKPEISTIHDILFKVKLLCQKMDKEIFNNLETYKEIESLLSSLDIKIDTSKLFQVDCNKEICEGSVLNKAIQDQLLECIHFLAKIQSDSNPNMEAFIASFYDRYEFAEKSLLDVLDPEKGIGYPIQDSKVENNLLKGVKLPYHDRSRNEYIKLSRIELLLLKKMIRNKAGEEIDLSELEELKNLGSNKQEFSLSTSLFFAIGSEQHGSPILLKGIGGSSAVNVLARFAHSNSKIKTLVFDIAAHEEKHTPSDALRAEIAHLPDDRIGNITLRPSFRGFEIPYLARSTFDANRVISLSDLNISVNPYQKEVIIRSSRYAKKILPHHSNAYNSRINRHSVFRFLSELQSQGAIKNLNLNLNKLSSSIDFIPRIRFKKIILQRATWNIFDDDLKLLIQKKISFREWKKRFNLPEIFVLKEGDNELIVDTKNPLSIQVFQQLIKKKKRIVLVESLFDGKNMLVLDQKGKGYAHEFIATLLNKQNVENSVASQNSPSLSKDYVKRNFIIGSNWLYYKLFCGVKSADTIISNYLLPLAEKYIREKKVSKWFFIRYREKDYHIRFRLHFVNPKDQGAFMIEFTDSLESLFKEGTLWKIKLDSYSREIERYKAQAIEDSETLFYHDSVSVARILPLIENSADKKFRAMAAFSSLDKYFDLFGLSLEKRYEQVSELSNSFGKEFGLPNKYLKRTLDKKYRDYRNDLDLLFKKSYSKTETINQILQYRTEAIKKSNLDLDKINCNLPSYLHMSINRLFEVDQRLNEFVLYYFLSKHYNSMIARLKYQSKNGLNP